MTEVIFLEAQTTQANKILSRGMIESTTETKVRTSLGVKWMIEEDQTASLVTLHHHIIKMRRTTTHFFQE